MNTEEFERCKDRRSLSKISARKFGTDLTNCSIQSSISNASIKKQSLPSSSEDFYQEMCKTLYENEKTNIPVCDYMLKQSDINSNMRAILIDWLVYIQYKLRYSGETLYLTVNLIDRYLERVQVFRKDLQLVGICCMLIACKYEELNIPKVSDLIYITDNAYRIDQVVDMESGILAALEFNVTFVSPLRFVERIVREMRFSRKMVFMSRYLMELALLDYRFIRIKPSVLAKACCLLVCVSEGREELVELEGEASVCAQELVKAVEVLRNCSLRAVWSKYSSEEYLEVAKFYKTPVVC